MELDDTYRHRYGGWAGLRRQAGFDVEAPGPDDHNLRSDRANALLRSVGARGATEPNDGYLAG